MVLSITKVFEITEELLVCSRDDDIGACERESLYSAFNVLFSIERVGDSLNFQEGENGEA